MCTELRGQMSFADCPDIAFLKMSPDYSVPTEERTSDACWRSLQGSQTKPLLCLCLKKGSGAKRELSKGTVTKSLGDYTTLASGAFPKDADELPLFVTSTDTMRLQSFLATVETGEAPATPIPSHLLDVLEVDADPKYDHSPKAAAGIIRRAKARGKELPPILQTALEQTIARATA